MKNNTIDLTPLRGLSDSSWATPLPPSDHEYFVSPAAPVIMAKPVSRLRRVLRAWPIFAALAVLGALSVLAVQDAMKYPDGYVPAKTRAVMNARTYPSAMGPVITVPLTATMPEEEEDESKTSAREGALPSAATVPAAVSSPPPPPASSCLVKLRVKKSPAKKRKQVAIALPIRRVVPKRPPPTIEDLLRRAAPRGPKMIADPKKVIPLPALTRSQIMVVLVKIRKGVQGCWDRFHVPGTADTRFIIMPNGEVAGLKILGRFSGTPTGACVAAAIGRQTFPKSGKPAKIRLPFRLR